MHASPKRQGWAKIDFSTKNLDFLLNDTSYTENIDFVLYMTLFKPIVFGLI